MAEKDRVKEKAPKGGTGKGVSASLELWQERLSDSDREFEQEVTKMREREALYAGKKRDLKQFTDSDVERYGGGTKEAPHIRNIIFENIEAQISSSIPQPKVTPRKENDENLAATMEHFLRNELDRLPFEIMNDLAERAVPIHGGVAWHVEWDNEAGTHGTVGDITVSVIHPMQLAPQPGVYTGIQDMDWIIIKQPTTKEAVRRKFGVDIEDEGESEPEIRTGGEQSQADDSVTQYIGYARNDNGGIDRIIWVNDTVLEELDDYQARKAEGKTLEKENIYTEMTTAKGLTIPGETPELDEFGDVRYEFNDPVIPEPPPGMDGLGVSGSDAGFDSPGLDMFGADTGFDRPGHDMFWTDDGFDRMGIPQPVMHPTQIPYYTPDMYPIVLQKSVTVYGQLMGNSDVDIIKDHQETINRMHLKVIERTLTSGSKIVAPNDTKIRYDAKEGDVIRLTDPAHAAFVRNIDLDGNISPAMAYMSHVYEESRQALGVTDSFQGRRDTTATSGKAKEFAAAQTAGRLESKRVMKDAAYADLFELMFKFALAYSDEPRTIVHKNMHGVNEYSTFSRYDFLEMDETGEYWWNDQFLFSCDASAPLASNREAMWQENRMNLQSGAYGNPTELETLILFWSRMEMLHYPFAGLTRKHLEEKLAEQKQAEQQAMMMQGLGGGEMPPGSPPGAPPMPGMMPGMDIPESGYMDGGPQLPAQILEGIERRAMEDAMRAAPY